MSALASITETLPLKTGIYYGLPFAQYLALPAVSRSTLWAMRRSPAHARVAREETPAMAFGTMVDDLLFNPAEGRYVVCPKVDGRTKLGKLANDAKRLMACNGVVPVDADEWARAQMVVGAVRASKTAQALLAGERQVTVVWQDEETGVWCKARPDVWNRDLQTLVDMKTTEDASIQSFRWSVRRFGYGFQLASYMDGLRACGERVYDAALVAVESAAPFAVACYRLDEASLAEGREQWRDKLRVYARCVGEANWPGYPDEVQELSIVRQNYATGDI